MEKIWLKSYPPGVPAEITIGNYHSVVDIFREACEKYRGKPAFSNMGTHITYGELAQQSQAFAAYLEQTLKLKKGDRVAIMLPNILQYPIVFFGILQAGLIAVNTNPLYTPTELIHQLNDAGAETVVILANFAHTLAESLPHLSIKNIIVTEVGDCFPSLKRTITNFVVKYIKKLVPKFNFPSIIYFRDILKQGALLSFKEIELVPEDIALLQYTGGTTGIAKGAMLTHKNIASNMLQAKAWIHSVIKEGEEIVITALPMYHIFSLTANCLTFLEMGGFNILITNPRDMKNFIKEIKPFKFTVMTGVNTLFNALLNQPEFKKLDFSHFKLSLGGGMAVQKAVAERWEATTGAPLLEAYGLTEASPAVTINPLNLKHFNGSIGLPISSTDISLMDGELCVKGPQVMLGYWRNPEETAKILTSDGWLHTGDIAKIDENGFVYIIDRKKDMIDVSGFKVFPNEVEGVLVSHPGILEAGVVGALNPDTGVETVKAVIVKKDPNLTKEDIIKYCQGKLTGYKVPKIIEFRDKLPKTNVGKILRRALR